jgi:preprotein translocase subunit SecG
MIMEFVKGLLMFLLLLTAVVLIVLVLIQRGKGGGLAGAFGGMGGQSAFGTKAGDLFTKITIGVATFWIILCMITIKVLGVGGGGPLSGLGEKAATKPSASAPASTAKPPAGGKSEATTPPAKAPAGGKAESPAAPAKGPGKP